VLDIAQTLKCSRAQLTSKIGAAGLGTLSGALLPRGVPFMKAAPTSERMHGPAAGQVRVTKPHSPSQAAQPKCPASQGEKSAHKENAEGHEKIGHTR